ncbi:MAG TPA: hypothetical protein VFL96_02970 [Acidobacteriaceae bacterium]|nr:hypothetical protein [Acidobacteriaceae bacterium]
MFLFRRTLANSLNRLLCHLDIGIMRPSEVWRTTELLGKQPNPPAANRGLNGAAMLLSFGAPADEPFDFAVVMPSLIRPTICRALGSVFSQTIPGRVQTLIGVDAKSGDIDLIRSACNGLPPNHSVMVFYPGYSTSVRHGGVHPCWDGGALRTILSYMAHCRRVAFLDDDNWWAPEHLQSMAAALEGHDWCWSRRWFVHPLSGIPICEDETESVGPGKGIFAANGGWADPNTLAIDKLRCEAVLRWWSIPLRNSPKAMDADRNVFRILSREFEGRPTNQATVYYTINESDPEHPARVDLIGPERYAQAGLMPSAGTPSNSSGWETKSRISRHVENTPPISS